VHGSSSKKKGKARDEDAEDSHDEDGSREVLSPSQRPTRERRPVDRFGDWDYSNFSIANSSTSAVVDESEPSSYEDAKSIGVWENAMKEEIRALEKNKTSGFSSPVRWSFTYFMRRGCTR